MHHYNPYTENLPIVDVFDQVKERLRTHKTLVLTAPPGAGKSTLLPLALLNEPWLKGKKILMLEPRRLAAKGIASRMANLIGENVGESIGYRIRFDVKVSEQTKIEILTEGILTRMLQSDSALEGVGLIIFDEFHERSIHADIALALTRETQSVLRDDLRLLIMSATIDSANLTQLLDAPLVESNGRQFPVDVIYEGEADKTLLPEAAANTVMKALKSHSGDVLVFLPGEREINNCATILKRKTDHEKIAIQELYGRLPQAKQYAAIHPNKQGKRKIVIATSIAETSLTIEGVKVVVDCGFARVAKFDTRSGLSGLRTIQITNDAADQRAGRAGRIEPGTCYRLWSKATQSKLTPHRIPEIMEADLTPLLLNLANWGIQNIEDLTWIDLPPSHAIKQATKNLENLEAIENGKITAHGKRMNQLPTHPRIAHMLLTAQEEGLLSLAADLAAVLEERDPLPKESGIDITLRVEALRRSRSNKQQGGKFARIDKISKQYRKMMKAEEDNGSFDPYEAGLLLVHAYPERIAFARPGNNAQFQLANGAYAMAGHKDDLAHEPWLAVANLNDRESGTGKIFLAAPLNPTDLVPFLKTQDIVRWSTKKGGLKAVNETRIGSIVLKSIPIDEPDQKLVQKAISQAIAKEGKSLLNFDKSVEQWQNRIITVKKWYPNENWPNTSTDFLLETNDSWLSPYLNNVNKPEELKKINLSEVLQFSLSSEQQRLLNELAPSKIQVPSGSHIELDYQKSGSTPILPVRIQEIFGLKSTPTVNRDEIKVLMHLLSPGYKIVQTTTDLESFWKSAYHEVRKELRIRYKRHAWPENPFEHEPLSGAKPRKK
ncbi:MAG: ATP-dependent helicase HrpB [Crocinitomix sp.]|jgi:ATP-dependent helicase HrpB